MNAGLYIHIPYCGQKCRYCDFYSITGCQEAAMAAYCDALIEEMRLRQASWEGYTFDTLFIGGGTPSLLPIHLLERVMEAVDVTFQTDFVELTLESNPGTLSRQKLDGYRALGFNRLSMGLQAKQDRLLKAIGRIHSYQDFVQGVGMAREAGFDNINVDLMSGLPEQTETDLVESIEVVAALGADHISLYTLKLEEGTPLCRDVEAGRVTLMDSDDEWAMHKKARKRLASLGYHRYEISNYAKDDKPCVHNLHTWRYLPYLGLGTAAASMMPGERWENVRSINDYIASIHKGEFPMAGHQIITSSDAAFEALMLGLRLVTGIDLDSYQEAFGIDLYQQFQSHIQVLMRDGLAKIDKGRLYLTAQGMDVQNPILCEFLEGWQQEL